MLVALYQPQERLPQIVTKNRKGKCMNWRWIEVNTYLFYVLVGLNFSNIFILWPAYVIQLIYLSLYLLGVVRLFLLYYLELPSARWQVEKGVLTIIMFFLTCGLIWILTSNG